MQNVLQEHQFKQNQQENGFPNNLGTLALPITPTPLQSSRDRTNMETASSMESSGQIEY